MKLTVFKQISKILSETFRESKIRQNCTRKETSILSGSSGVYRIMQSRKKFKCSLTFEIGKEL
jgi:hypothetical protein